MALVPSAWGRSWSIALGVLLILGGIASISEPLFASIAAGLFFGGLIFVSGIAHLIYAWSQRSAGAVIWEVLIGLLYVAASIFMFWNPAGGIAALTLVLAAYIAVKGILELVIFFRLRRRAPSFWFLFDALMSLVLAALIFFHWPSSAFWALGLLLGCSLLFSGIARIALPMRPGSVLRDIDQSSPSSYETPNRPI